MGTTPTTSRHGILNPAAAGSRFGLERRDAPPALGAFVERFWIVTWDAGNDSPYVSETLPHPSVNVVFETNELGISSAIHGISTRRFERALAGRGRAIGVKFRPGGFQPWLGRSMHELTNEVWPLERVFGPEAEALDAFVRGADVDAALARIAAFLRERAPESDPNVELVADVVRVALESPTMVDVEVLAARVDLPVRALQRLFRKYVGVSPKWVLRRFRIHEAAARVASGEAFEWARLANELGYCDQSHFVADWRSQLGRTPTDYAALCRAERERAGKP